MERISQGDSVFQKSGAESAKRAEGPGLVSSVTSGTPNHQTHITYIIDSVVRRFKSLQRAVKTAARLHQQALESQKARFKVAMLTLTYRPGQDWQDHQISDLLRHVRQYLKRRGQSFRYVWVMETTKAGVPHYHIMIWLPKGQTLPKPDKQGWWPYGNTRIEWVKKSVSYIAKYASKANSERPFPKGARAYGVGGLMLQDRREKAYWQLPQYIRETTPEPRLTGVTKRHKGGGWLTPFGEWLPSRYRIISFNPIRVQEVSI